MTTKLRACIRPLVGAVTGLLLAGCSINPSLDVPYTSDGAPSLADLLNKMYCELMSTADNLETKDQAAFVKEDMGVIITLKAVGLDQTSPSLNPPAFSGILLALTGTASRQRTNVLTVPYSFKVGQLYADRKSGKTKFDCQALQDDLAGNLNLERYVRGVYNTNRSVGFRVSPTDKTATNGYFSGEVDFQVVRSVSPAKFTFLSNLVIGPNSLTFSDTGTNQMVFAFAPEPKPAGPPQAIPVYTVPCPTGIDCTKVHGFSNFSAPVGTGGVTGPGPATETMNPGVLEQLNRQPLFSFPGAAVQ